MARSRRTLISGAYACLLLFLFYSFFSLDAFRYLKIHDEKQHLPSDVYLRRGPFEAYEISGFANTGQLSKQSCDAFRYNGTVGVQRSIPLPNNLMEVAAAVDGHERLDYKPEDLEDPNLTAEALVEKMWHQMSGSSVWLPDLQVYFLVTRVFFSEDRFWPTISFLRGLVFDEDWTELHDYTIKWEGRSYKFPMVFNIEAPYTMDGVFFGPEDPRIIMEDGIEGAEPVITFNMVGPITEWKRAMYIFRPFSDKLTLLTIGKLARPDMEKNWAPFFVPQYVNNNSLIRQPNEYIHFVYNHKPVRIIRCHLRCGDCEFVFEQTVPPNLFASRQESKGDLRGGSNFIPVPLDLSSHIRRNIDVWAVFPRTHIETNCGALYRPELVVMIRVDSHFYMAFASKSLDFGSAVVQYGPEDTRCSKGRIMIPMSLARWDTQPSLIEVTAQPADVDSAVTHAVSDLAHTDVLTLTLSIDDNFIHIARITGLLNFVKGIPQVRALLNTKASKGAEKESLELRSLLSTWVADDVRGCLVESAINYTETLDETSGKEINKPHEKQKLLMKEYAEKKQAKLLADGKLGPEHGLSHFGSSTNEISDPLPKEDILPHENGFDSIEANEPVKPTDGIDPNTATEFDHDYMSKLQAAIDQVMSEVSIPDAKLSNEESFR